MNHLQAVGAYLRFNSALPQKLVNMIALLTSRHYTQQYEWDGNYPLSLKSGLSADIANAIGEGLRMVARCPDDGIIEALEGSAPEHFVLAVQWHPERSVDEDEASRAIFHALITAASQSET
jgi:hypothetical protein